MTDTGTDGRRRTEVVVVGASAGGVSALREFVSYLPDGLPAVVLIVLHLPTHGSSVLADILARRCKMPVRRGEDGAVLEPGTVIVAPPDRHLSVSAEHMHLREGPRVNGHRPAIDPLLESAARSFGGRAFGILLSGTLDDGVAGLAAVRRRGGVAAVQDPQEAAYPGMPVAAIEAGVADHVLRLKELADLVCRSTDEADASAGTTSPGAAGSGLPTAPAHDRLAPEAPLDRTDDPHEGAEAFQQAGMSCPACGGTLWADRVAGDFEQFECRVGHRYSASSLYEAQGDALEDALWAAERALLERADLGRRMARRLRRTVGEAAALRYDRVADEADERARVVRGVIASAQPSAPVAGR
jgi:two-component system chemotaxis response regulator CheB